MADRQTRILQAWYLAATALWLAGCGAYGGGGNGGGGGGSAPVAPTGLTAAAANAQVSLTWNASSGATGYYVKRSTSSGTEVQIAAQSGTAYSDNSVSNGTKYYYVVSAYNSYGQSANSAEVNATPVAPPPPVTPAAPTGLTASGGNGQVSLSWTASVGAASYNVKRSTTSGGPYAALVASPPVTNYVDTTVANSTTYYYVVTAVNSSGESGNSNQASAMPGNAVADVTITIDPTKTRAISPWIYGTNFYSGNTAPQPNFTFDRAGGNRWTAYNWETNASNAGSDYFYQNDNYLSASNVPAEAVRSFIAGDQGAGLASLVTFQLQGYVSADESGPVARPFPNLSRFKQVIEKKSTRDATSFTINPPTSDAYVYMDEFAWALDQKFPGQGIFGVGPTHPTFISFDNEPDLWNSTHEEVQGSTNISSDNYLTKTVTLSKALKDQFPNVVIFGPVNYGFNGIYSWQGEAGAGFSSSFWFADKYLAGIKTASTTYGKPLVDVYDFHWYSEATDGTTRVINMTGTSLTDTQIQAIVQSPRSLWDTTFKENSWITNSVLGGPIYILGRLQARIDAENPGMKIAITEYENGGFNHIAGTIAQADNLGIFGSQGVFAANFWPPGGPYPYALAGFRAFRGFDGANANFGDTSLRATSSAVEDVVVYASTDTTAPGRLVFVAINRSNAAKVTAINGQVLSGTAHLYQMTATSASGQTVVQPVSIGTTAVSGSSLAITLPAYSVTTIDVH
ncbi:MAG TPA: glycoside hydrolase family 44 protein [Candidatus Polarisedimenticolia bacterium]|nr:glycoside hydrolase family 44 protein [Candidatus Polarisedimenticolia bacterium]